MLLAPITPGGGGSTAAYSLFTLDNKQDTHDKQQEGEALVAWVKAVILRHGGKMSSAKLGSTLTSENPALYEIVKTHFRGLLGLLIAYPQEFKLLNDVPLNHVLVVQQPRRSSVVSNESVVHHHHHHHHHDTSEREIVEHCRAILELASGRALKAVDLANALRSRVGTETLARIRTTHGGLLTLLERHPTQVQVRRVPKHDVVSLLDLEHRFDDNPARFPVRGGEEDPVPRTVSPPWGCFSQAVSPPTRSITPPLGWGDQRLSFSLGCSFEPQEEDVSARCFELLTSESYVPTQTWPRRESEDAAVLLTVTEQIRDFSHGCATINKLRSTVRHRHHLPASVKSVALRAFFAAYSDKFAIFDGKHVYLRDPGSFSRIQQEQYQNRTGHASPDDHHHQSSGENSPVTDGHARLLVIGQQQQQQQQQQQHHHAHAHQSSSNSPETDHRLLAGQHRARYNNSPDLVRQHHHAHLSSGENSPATDGRLLVGHHPAQQHRSSNNNSPDGRLLAGGQQHHHHHHHHHAHAHQSSSNTNSPGTDHRLLVGQHRAHYNNSPDGRHLGGQHHAAHLSNDRTGSQEQYQHHHRRGSQQQHHQHRSGSPDLFGQHHNSPGDHPHRHNNNNSPDTGRQLGGQQHHHHAPYHNNNNLPSDNHLGQHHAAHVPFDNHRQHPHHAGPFDNHGQHHAAHLNDNNRGMLPFDNQGIPFSLTALRPADF